MSELESWTAAQLRPGEWPVALEKCLFEATARHRPVGINGHINMALLYLEMQTRVPDITPQIIWEHLRTMYNMVELDGGEGPSWLTFVRQAEEGGESGDEEDDGDFIDFRLPSSLLPEDAQAPAKRKRA